MQTVKSDLINFFAILATVLGLWFAFLHAIGGIEHLTMLQYSVSVIFGTVLATSVLCGLVGVLILRERLSVSDLRKDSAHVGASRIELDYVTLCGQVKERLWVLGISLPYFRTEIMIEKIRSLANEHVDIRLLVANPAAPFLSERPESLYTEAPLPAVASAETLRIFWRLKSRSLSDEASRHVKIAVTSSIPTVGIIIADDTVVWSPFLVTDTGAKSPYVKHKTTEINRKISSHFENVWSHHSLHIESAPTMEILERYYKETYARNAEKTKTRLKDIARILDGG